MCQTYYSNIGQISLELEMLADPMWTVAASCYYTPSLLTVVLLFLATLTYGQL